MKTARAALHATQIIAGITGIAGIAAVGAIAAARALMPGPPKRHRGHVVLITGGSRGLGLALAHRFGRSGAKLVLVSRNSDDLTHARNTLLAHKAVQHADDVLLLPADLTDPEQAAKLIDYVVGFFGHIDILINNAGVIEVGPVEDQPIQAYQRAMATNFFATLYTTNAALPHLLQRSPTYGQASIVNIASIGGKFAMPHMLPYVASKFALVGYSQGLHAELRHKGIRVTTVCPGLMRTGGESHAHFTGQTKKEQRWFKLSSKTPVLAVSVNRAADHIYNAVVAGRAEITITPQAWLGARMAGLAPETTQFLASLVNEFVLPPSSSHNLSIPDRGNTPPTKLAVGRI
jgi:NAD(P)-dependent dehydrogenase (short-subunit alcohol dehydrogenase family)